MWRRGAARRGEIEMLAEFLRQHLPEGAVAIPQDDDEVPDRSATG